MKLTPEQFELLKSKFNEHFATGNLRRGQSYMVALFDVNSDLYKEITGTNCDPFYLDSRIDEFLKRII